MMPLQDIQRKLGVSLALAFKIQDLMRGASLAAPTGSDESELRRMLAWSYSGHHLYSADGELQDSQEQPFIDFKRDTIAELKDKMEQRGLNRLHRELHQNDGAMQPRA